jgi:methylenetetrahydrofolate dehydrogenase (NADP+)/methenyltetrahydrofolate cyclohydrolase
VPAKIIDGAAIAEEVRQEVAQQATALAERTGVPPGLRVVLVGDNPASVSYVRGKTRAAEEVSMDSDTIRLPDITPEEDLLDVVRELNADPRVHGILVQLPLPQHIDERRILNAISPDKDVDGLHPLNVGKLMRGEPYLLPCTPSGVVEMLLRTGNSPEGKHVVVCGRSNLVGKPLAAMLLLRGRGGNATVTVCHTGTTDLPYFTRQADILVAAIGRPYAITADMVRPGAVVIDVGINRVDDASRKSGYRLVGDVDFDAVAEVAGAITPVPGGVGPMTIAMLLHNTVKAAETQLLRD